MPPPDPQPAPDDPWLTTFHAGARPCLERCYREHFETVDRAVGAILRGADRETVVHEVFFRLLSDPGLRQSFRGGNFGGWLRVVARNHSLDHARRRRLEVSLDDAPTGAVEDRLEARTHLRLALERFRAHVLPPRWERVFVARFVEQQDQPTAARALGMRRTTLAYQEYRIRALLRRFMLRGEGT
jgi:RNA polymerase sigma-70 factor (ECF subfamily)